MISYIMTIQTITFEFNFERLPYVFVINIVITSGCPPGLHFGAFSQKRLLRPNPTAELTLFYLRTIRRAYEKHQPHPSRIFSTEFTSHGSSEENVST
jgi:hypothetical protein